MNGYVRHWSRRYYVERHWPDNRKSVVLSCPSEDDGWAAVETYNREVEGCWHVLTCIERWEVELERR